MNQLYYILLLFSILFLLENKAINILICFVGLLITLALIIPTIKENGIINIEAEYYSYILILVQVSALTILFGFIIMLFPTLSYSKPTNIDKKFFSNNYYYLFFLLVILILYNIEIPILSDIVSKINSSIYIIQDKTQNINQDTFFLRKLGYYLYHLDNNIIKLLILTIILLLTIIALFFITPSL